MTSSASLPRNLIIFGAVLPVAALVGFLIATPDDLLSIAGVGMVVSILALPIVLKWHHALFVASLNAALVLAFFPGSPSVWMAMAFVSLGMTLLTRILDKNSRLNHVPALTWPVLAFGAVVLFTAHMTGGVGLRTLGTGAYGGKKYFYIWFAIVAYFALSMPRIPWARAHAFVSAYLLSALTSILSNLVYVAGPAMWVLYYFIPADLAVHQFYEDFGGSVGTRFSRMGGMAAAGYAIVPYLIYQYGIRGLLNADRPWRMVILIGATGLSMLGGFRSALAFFLILSAVQFINEGLLRTRYLPVVATVLIVGFLALIPLAPRLPASIQRSLSVLQVPVSAAARLDAEESTRWRLEMWQLLRPEIPRYFWMGKGFTASATDYYLTQEMVRRQMVRDYEATILAGDYHSGPFSIIIPFGIWGVLAFVWFVYVSLRALYANQRFGEARLKKINVFLLSYYISKLFFFIAIFGAIHLDILTFLGIVGLSVSLNGGVHWKPSSKETSLAEPKLEPSVAAG